MERVLLICPEGKQCLGIKCLIYLNNCRFETCPTIEEGFNRYLFAEEGGCSFDLVLLVADKDQVIKLEVLKIVSFYRS